MAISGIFNSLSGVQTAEKRLRQSSHNLANASTPGFQPGRVEQAETAQGGIQVSAVTMGQAGPVRTTNRALDLAIDGGGFFVVRDENGQQLYTRAGNFQTNAQGQLTDQSGRAVAPGIEIPAATAQLEISANGQVRALDADGQVLAQGQLETAVFANPGGLQAVGGNAFAETAASGPPVMDAPGAAGHGEIVSGALLGSGTDIATEMVNMIVSQRTAEANIKAVQAHDENLGSILDIVG